MKKINVIIISISLIITLCLCVSAETIFPETNGVYATDEEQNRIMTTVMADEMFVKRLAYQQVMIDKTSIMPLYAMDVVDYSQNGILNIYRDGFYYFCDCIDENGNFAGVLLFYADSEKAEYHSFSPAWVDAEKDQPEIDGKANAVSQSFRSHEDYIKANIGEDVTEKDVIFAGSSDISNFQGFFIRGNENRKDVFVQIGLTSYWHQIIPVETDLKEIGQKEYNKRQEYLAEKEQWEKEHPGETYIAVGGSGLDSYRSENGLSPLAVTLISAAGVVLIAAVIVTVVVIRKKKQIQTAKTQFFTNTGIRRRYSFLDFAELGKRNE